MVKIANAVEDAAVTMTQRRNLVTTTQRRKRLLMVLFLHFVAYFDVETVRPGSLLLMDRLVSPVGADVAEDMVEETPTHKKLLKIQFNFDVHYDMVDVVVGLTLMLQFQTESLRLLALRVLSFLGKSMRPWNLFL